jgi:hypothetical protein
MLQGSLLFIEMFVHFVYHSKKSFNSCDNNKMCSYDSNKIRRVPILLTSRLLQFMKTLDIGVCYLSNITVGIGYIFDGRTR